MLVFSRAKKIIQLLVACCFLTVGRSITSAKSPDSNCFVLTNAAQIRGLAVVEAARHPPVSLQGVVVLTSDYFVIMVDSTAGIYLAGTNGMFSQFQVGDVLSVTGVADPGEFAPIVKVSHVAKTGIGEIPPARPVGFPELQTGRFDAQWIEISGVVRLSAPLPDLPEFWELRVAMDGGQLSVRLSAKQGRLLQMDSEVRLRGACLSQFNKTRQVGNPVLQVPDGRTVFVTRPAPAEPFAVAERPISSLMQFNTGNLFSHRVRVSGVVTHAVMGEGFWILNGGEGLHVHSLQNQMLGVGDRVDVLGFLKRGDYSPMLEDAIFRKNGKAERPVPLPLSDPLAALDHDDELVQLDAQILEQRRLQDGCRLVLRNGSERFTARLRLEDTQEIPRTWLTGSRVRVVGICQVAAGTKVASAAGIVDPGSFQILLRSRSDLVILKPPPWWTTERVGWAVAAVLGGLLVIGSGIFWWHRLRIKRQLATMKAQAVLAAERTRIARDLHDEIGANLTNISILSTLASQSAGDQAKKFKQHCSDAASVAQQTIRAFDEILWSVNPRNDTLHSLSHYICRYAEETLGPAGITYRFNLDETFPDLKLPPNCRHGLLLAVKEALHNIIKHAAAKRVEIGCTMAADRVFLVRVADDGCGTDLYTVAAAPQLVHGHGLENLRRRLQELGGECRLESAPGKGTQVIFRLPL